MNAARSGPCAKCNSETRAGQLLVGFDGKCYCDSCVAARSETLLDYLREYDSFFEAIPEEVSGACGSRLSVVRNVIRAVIRPTRARMLAAAAFIAWAVPFGVNLPLHMLLELLFGPFLVLGAAGGLFTLADRGRMLHPYTRDGTAGKSILIKDGEVYFRHQDAVMSAAPLEKCVLSVLDEDGYSVVFGAKGHEMKARFGIGALMLCGPRGSWTAFWHGDPVPACLCGWTDETREVLTSFFVLAGWGNKVYNRPSRAKKA